MHHYNTNHLLYVLEVTQEVTILHVFRDQEEGLKGSNTPYHFHNMWVVALARFLHQVNLIQKVTLFCHAGIC